MVMWKDVDNDVWFLKKANMVYEQTDSQMYLCALTLHMTTSLVERLSAMNAVAMGSIRGESLLILYNQQKL